MVAEQVTGGTRGTVRRDKTGANVNIPLIGEGAGAATPWIAMEAEGKFATFEIERIGPTLNPAAFAIAWAWVCASVIIAASEQTAACNS
jgi:hypothetical protein